MIEIEVEAHADRISRDEKLDIAGLIESDLGVARPGRKRAEHDSRAAALATDQLGNRVNVLRRKRDDRRPRRQPRNLFLAAVCQFRRRGRDMKFAPGIKSLMASRMVCAPSSNVSDRPRACSSRSVKTWPRSGSPAS